MADNISLAERAKRFLAQHGGVAETAVAALLRDNKKLRDERRTLREQSPYRPDETLARENQELQSENERLAGLVPPAGAILLTGDDATLWPKYKGLHLAPEKIAELQQQHGELAAQLADRDRRDVMARAAETLKWKPTTLAKIAAAEGLHIEFKDLSETNDGRMTKTSVPHVRPAKDEKAALEPLREYAERELKDYLPALRVNASGEEDEDAGMQSGGVEFLEQENSNKPTRANKDKLVEAARASGDYQF